MKNKVEIVGFLIRLVVLFVGSRVLDRSTTIIVPYTDIDYHIFSDAAKLVVAEQSPYERATYRYPPSLAWLLTPNEYLSFPEWGKVVFALADVAVISLIHAVNMHYTRTSSHRPSANQAHSTTSMNIALWTAWLWSLNPLAINICTRGSADSLTNGLVLWVLYSLLQLVGHAHEEKTIVFAKSVGWYWIFEYVMLCFCGGIYGLLIHLRVYPVIYMPGFAMFLLRSEKCPLERVQDGSRGTSSSSAAKPSPSSQTTTKQTNPTPTLLSSVFSFLHGYWSRVFVFFIGTSTSLFLSTWMCYEAYGWDYLNHAILYHFSRSDHRHNFSPMFYSIYLSKSISLHANSGIHAPNMFPSTGDGGGGGGGGGGGSPLSSTAPSMDWLKISTLVLSLGLFVPQMIILIVAAITLAPLDLPSYMLVVTFAFVAFNKVITAQYFTWFACLLLVVFPRVIHMSNVRQSHTDIDVTNDGDTNHNQSNLHASSQISQSNHTAPIQNSQSNHTARRQTTSHNYYIILACLILLWASALGWWLWCAYCLEFLGQSVYFSLWIASELFFVANAVVIVSIIVIVRRSLSLYHQHRKNNQSDHHHHHHLD